MLDLLASFLNTVISLVNFIVNSITSLLDLIIQFPTYLSFLSTSFGFMPSIFISFLLCSIAIYVVFFIIDR